MMKASQKKEEQSSFFTLPGHFVTFEGGEGAGKTTLMNKLAEELTARGYFVVKTREPGGSKLGEQIRQWLLNADFHALVGQKAELLLFLAARAQHIQEVIQPALQAGHVVLCDRFNDSTIAYQGAGRHLGEEMVGQICALVSEGLVPDLTLYLDVDPKKGLERTKRTTKENAHAGTMDRIEAEKLEFHERVRRAFQQIVLDNPERVVTIDANQSEEAVYQEAVKVLKDNDLL